jgi:YVTN family beta-propeller protein
MTNRLQLLTSQPYFVAQLRFTRLWISAMLLLCLMPWRFQFALAATAADYTTTEPVSRGTTNRQYTPANQVLTPAGVQVELPGMRPQALALSPDGKLLVTAGKSHELVVLNPAGQVLQRVPLPAEGSMDLKVTPVTDQIQQPDKEAQVSFTGLVFSPDGSRLYLANVNGSIKVFRVEPTGTITGLGGISIPTTNVRGRKEDIPAGLAVSRDGKRLYVVLNFGNRLAELDAANWRLLRVWEVGVAPYEVVLAGNKAYVSNWGGRRPERGSVTGPAGRGTLVRVDPVRYIANEGSVSVIDLAPSETQDGPGASPGAAQLGKARAEILTGLHASAMALSPDGRWLVVANAGSDTLSVIDTRTDLVTETIWARQTPADLFGAQPNALAFDKSGKMLFVCNGSQNAVGVIQFSPGNPGQSKLEGLIPVGWFPGAIVFDAALNSIYVANIKAIGTGRARGDVPLAFNSLQFCGSLSLVKVPSPAELAQQTKAALANMRYPLLEQAALPARPGQAPRPVPERVGEPSVFEHVVYVIKENRTFDQVLGDVTNGNGNAALCIFGERVTPNQHKLTRDFVLLDNTYCSGILSADGHQWADTALVTDYLEKSFAGFPRSYPTGADEGSVDALAYAPSGFIWDNALAHHKSLRVYGEFVFTQAGWKDSRRKPAPAFLDFYRDFQQQKGETAISGRPGIESLGPFVSTNTPGWNLSIPDVYRARQFISELKQFEQSGQFPNLIVFSLPNDHTSGTKAGFPTPDAQVADNDLALGQIIEAISHSRFWPKTCVFVIEDDPQDGWDHVSGYRTSAYVASAYSRRRTVVSTQYNQTSIVRTIELILGLPPMNQFDATATPMFDCFVEKADLTPFDVVTNNIPLDKMNPEPKQVQNSVLRKEAYASARLPLAQPDQCPEDVLNRILWHAMKGPDASYPTWAVQHVADD